MTSLVLEEAGPFVEHHDQVWYRGCDFCYETATEDIWAGKLDQSEWRTFYLLPDGCSLCSNCLEKGAHIE